VYNTVKDLEIGYYIFKLYYYLFNLCMILINNYKKSIWFMS